MYEHYEDTVALSVYDDHDALAKSDELAYVYLCEECAEDRGAGVTLLSNMAAGQSEHCDGGCGRANRAREVEEEYEDDEQYW